MCTKRNVTGEYVLACCLFATMMIKYEYGNFNFSDYDNNDQYVSEKETIISLCVWYGKYS